MRLFVTFLGVLAALVVMAISAYFNFRYAQIKYSAGVELDGLMFGTVSVAFDVSKAIVPLICGWAWYNKRYFGAVVGAVYVAGCMMFSLTASSGLIAEKRATYVEKRAASSESYDELRVQLDEARRRVARLGSPRPVATIEAELQASRQQRRWKRTAQCSDATSTKSRAFCTAYNKLQAELATAQAFATETSTVSRLATTLQSLRQTGGVKDEDPQLTFLGSLTSISKTKMNVVLISVMVILLELGSAFGLYIALNHRMVPQPTKNPPVATGSKAVRSRPVPETKPQKKPSPAAPQNDVMNTIASYMTDRLDLVDGKEIELGVIHTDYCAWCQEEGKAALSRRAFALAFEEVANQVKINLKRAGKKKFCLDMQLKSAAA